MMRRDNKQSFQVPRNKMSILSCGQGSEYSGISNDEGSNQSDDYMGQGRPLEYQFNPKQFYWLFNPYIKFNKRKGFQIEGEIESKDFLNMRDINRKNLTAFISKVSRQKKSTVNEEQMFNSLINSDSLLSSPDRTYVSISPPIRHNT